MLLLLRTFIWILITSRNCCWDYTSLCVNSWDFLGLMVPRNTIWTNGRKNEVFLVYSLGGKLKSRNCSSFIVIQKPNPLKQLGSETLKPSRIPNCAEMTNRFWPSNLSEVSSVCSRRSTMGAVRLPNAQVHRWLQLCLCPGTGDTSPFTDLLPSSLWLRQGEMCVKMPSWLVDLKEREISFFFEGAGTCNCILNTISFSFLLTQLIASLQSDVKNWERDTN